MPVRSPVPVAMPLIGHGGEPPQGFRPIACPHAMAATAPRATFQRSSARRQPSNRDLSATPRFTASTTRTRHSGDPCRIGVVRYRRRRALALTIPDTDGELPRHWTSPGCPNPPTSRSPACRSGAPRQNRRHRWFGNDPARRVIHPLRRIRAVARGSHPRKLRRETAWDSSRS